MKAVTGRACAALALLLPLLAPAARAQTPSVDTPPVDVEALGLEPDRERRSAEERERYLDRHRQEAEMPGEVVIEGGNPGGGKLPETEDEFVLQGIAFTSSHFIGEQRLEEIGSDYVGRPIRFAGINEMIGRINAIYAERGLVSARALVPPQSVDGGILQVRLVEGRLGELHIEENRMIREGFIRRQLDLKEGEVVDAPRLQQQLTRLNRTAGFSLWPALRAGQTPGSSDLLLTLKEPQRWQTQSFVDNLGTESTGVQRLGVTTQVYAPLGWDDRLNFYLLGSEGAANLFLSYDIPVNRYGGRLELSHSRGDIDIVNGPYRDLDIAGDSRAHELGFTQPILREDHHWLDIYTRYAQSHSNTYIGGSVQLGDFDTARYSLGARLQGFGASSYWSLTQEFVTARVDDHVDAPMRTLIYSGDASYQYRFNERVNVRGHVNWQYSKEETVLSPLQFQIGGLGSVRGYDNGIAAGARGYYLNLEGSYQLSDSLLPFAFIDYGQIRDVIPEKMTISGIGLGLNWSYSPRFSGELVWGKALDKVVPDQDSSRLQVRINAAF